MKLATQKIEIYRNLLKKDLLRICPSLNANELELLAQKTTLAQFSKNEIIINAGSYSDKVYFIIKGMVRIFYVKENKEITNVLLAESSVLAGSYSFITGNKNFSTYQAIEKTIALYITNEDLEELYQKHHSIEHLGRLIIEQYYAKFMKKTYDILFLSAEERYTTFVNNHPELLNRIPLKYIASYLGIAQATLSRLRAK